MRTPNPPIAFTQSENWEEQLEKLLCEAGFVFPNPDPADLDSVLNSHFRPQNVATTLPTYDAFPKPSAPPKIGQGINKSVKSQKKSNNIPKNLPPLTYQVDLAPEVENEFTGNKKDFTVTITNEKEKGHGTFSKIFEANFSGQRVALKINKHEELAENMKKEYNMLRVLSSSHILPAFGLLKNELGTIMGMMTPLMWGTLREYLINHPNLSEYDRIFFALQCAKGIQHMHDLRILHRDIKPDNMLIGDQGLCISDLGTAALLPQNSDDMVDTYLATTYIYAHYSLIVTELEAENALAELNANQNLEREQLKASKKFFYNRRTDMRGVECTLYEIARNGKYYNLLHLSIDYLKNNPNKTKMQSYVDNWDIAKNESSAEVNASPYQNLAEIYNNCESRSYNNMRALVKDLENALSKCPPPSKRIQPVPL